MGLLVFLWLVVLGLGSCGGEVLGFGEGSLGCVGLVALGLVCLPGGVVFCGVWSGWVVLVGSAWGCGWWRLGAVGSGGVLCVAPTVGGSCPSGWLFQNER